MPRTHVRYCRSFDGAQIAYAVSGQGPKVVLLPSWLTHLEYQSRCLAWRPWLDALSSRYTLLRYDPRGCGLSERNVDDLSFDFWVRDFATLVDEIRWDRFAVVGICQGGPTAIEYAARHPGRVERLWISCTGAVVVALLAADMPSAQTAAVEREPSALSIEELKQAHLACDREAMQRALPAAEAMMCSVIYERLKQRAFGGDFDSFLAWSRANSSTPGVRAGQ